MANESELDLANREFEQIAPGFTDTMSERFRTAFQIVTIAPGLPNIGQRAYTAPGSAPYQTGPSIAATALSPGSAPGAGGEGSRLKHEALLWRVGDKAMADAVVTPAMRYRPPGVRWSAQQRAH